MSNANASYYTDQATGRQVIELDFDRKEPATPVLQTPAGQVNTTSFKIRRAVDTLRREGYEVPEELDVAVTAINRLRRVQDAPVPPSLSDPKFDAAFTEYATELDKFSREQAARAEAYPAAEQELSEIAIRAVDPILGQMKDDFAKDADAFGEAHRLLNGCESLEDAARADITGRLVGVWNERVKVAERMSTRVDVLKKLLDHVQPLGWSTEQVVSFFCDIPTGYHGAVRDDVRGSSAPGPVKRFATVLDLGLSIALVESVDDWASRLATAD